MTTADLKVYSELNELKRRGVEQVKFNAKLWDAFVSLTMVMFANDLHERECPRFENKSVACNCIMAPVPVDE